MKTLVCIVGPTAIGKTSLSIEIAKHFNTEIISADSRQFFQEMSIGTAKPTLEELAQAPHHFIGNKSIKELYTAGTFEKEALTLLDDLFTKHDIIICVGGSGLYVKALKEGIDDIPSDIEIRNTLNNRLKEESIEILQEELKQLDPLHFSEMDHKNPQRLIRALEVCLASGKPYSSFRKNTSTKRPFKCITIGLTAPKETIYDRINKRVNIMINQGLINEVKSLTPFKRLNALNTVGYKEVFDYLDDITSKERAIELIKQHTRQFAKRQLTWFKKDTNTHWFNNDELNEIIPFLLKEIKD